MSPRRNGALIGRSTLHRALIVAAGLAVASGAAADYHVQRGDLLDVSVFGAPDLSRRTTVDIDGNATVPLLGPVSVAGLSTADVRTKLNALMAANKLVKIPEVTVEVAEYRPVYVKGAVVAAGAFPFRPGMVVRQVVALAGGRGLQPAGVGGNSDASLAELRADYAAVSTQFASKQAHLDRLRAELDAKATIDFTVLRGRSLSPSLVAAFQSLESQQLALLRTATDERADHLKVMAGFASDQLATLDLQRKEVELGVQLQQDEVDKVRGLFQKGVITSTRLTDEQRALSATKTQLLANVAQAGDVRRLRADFDDKVREANDSHRLQTLKDYEQTLEEIEKLRARMTADGQKLIALKDSGAQPKADVGQGPTYTIYRRGQAGASVFTATEDSEVEPGDVIEVVDADVLLIQPPAPTPAPGAAAATPPGGPSITN